MIDHTFVERMLEEARRPEVVEVDGQPRLMVPPGWKHDEGPVHVPDPLAVSTLTAVVGYLRAKQDGEDRGRLAIVAGPELVRVVGPLQDQELRPCYLEARVPREPVPFGRYQDAETFLVGLMSRFVPTEERQLVVDLLGAIRESDVRDTVEAEGGLAQEVKVGRGVALVGEARVPNPVTLAPYRTFSEVDQPSSAFVLRLRKAGGGEDRPSVALFEADGGAWRLAARKSVEDYLVALLAEAELDVPVLA